MKSTRAFGAATLLILATTALIAGALLFRASERGLGFSPDSVSYFTMAEGLMAGKGFVDVRRYDTPAATTYPPGYPLLLAAGGLAHGDLMASIPFVHALLFAFAALLCVGAVAAVAKPSARPFLTLAAALLFLASGDMIKLYTKVWSETAFLVATLLFILFLARHLERPSWRILSFAAMAAGWAVLIRYPGVATLFGGCLALLILRRTTIKRRLQEAFLFGALGSLPLVLWLARNIVVFSRPFLGKERGPSSFAFSSRNLELGLETLKGWTGQPAGIYLLCLAGLFLGLGLKLKAQATEDPRREDEKPEKPAEISPSGAGAGLAPAPEPAKSTGSEITDLRRRGGARPLPHLRGGLEPAGRTKFRLSPSSLLLAAAAFSLPYIAVMLLGTFAYGLHKPLDSRALAPLFAPLLWSVLLAGQASAPRWVQKWIPTHLTQRGSVAHIGSALAALSSLALIYFAGHHVHLASDPAKAYGILQKRPRAVVEAFKNIEPSGTVFTNIDDYLYMLTGKPCLRLPQVYSLDSRDIRLPSYDEKMAELKARLGEAGMIVYYSPSRRLYLPSEEELMAYLELEVALKTADGTIYRVARSSP